MPEKAGWRMRNRNRTKESKINTNAAFPAEESSHRSSGWLKSRPSTPTTATDDTRSEGSSEALTPRRATRPKISRYLSGLPHFKENIDSTFTQDWWNEIQPLPAEPPLSPEEMIRSVSKHMHGLPAQPIPISMFNGLFRVFEDHRKIKEERTRLDQELRETLDAHDSAADRWCKAEAQYQEEIRRLDLLIARGTSGMTGLAQARKHSVIKRKRINPNKATEDFVAAPLANLPEAQLNQEIKSRSKKVILQRPHSPSTQMAVLSKQLAVTGHANDIHIGTPPTATHKLTLSQKVQSELELNKMGRMNTTSSAASSADSEFAIAGDALSDEEEIGPSFSLMNTTIGHEAFIALQDLGLLVAQKKGIDPRIFINGLMQLLESDQHKLHGQDDTALPDENSNSLEVDKIMPQKCAIPPHPLKHSQSQPLLDSEERHRFGHHFSFEPGDDKSYPMAWGRSPQAQSRQAEVPNSDGLSPLTSNFQKPSKIPSPLHKPGLWNVRREGSISSLNSGGSKTENDERRDSRSSILTAYRSSNGKNPRTASPGATNYRLTENADPHVR
ncbi:hypothetical protein DM02DRAFT_631800 [Periconia macrospinosa]|uniref:Uncharacterized protein n=1 Tax=Periconia macrospinosa TaxID=97972 RepID=A0A2V1DGD6_9PLEO|nr:hypothetical protein DM02DRAFT_631800 [Periconia macrospinosa]